MEWVILHDCAIFVSLSVTAVMADTCAGPTAGTPNIISESFALKTKAVQGKDVRFGDCKSLQPRRPSGWHAWLA